MMVEKRLKSVEKDGIEPFDVDFAFISMFIGLAAVGNGVSPCAAETLNKSVFI